MYCRKCGTQIEQNWVYCKCCGTRLPLYPPEYYQGVDPHNTAAATAAGDAANIPPPQGAGKISTDTPPEQAPGRFARLNARIRTLPAAAFGLLLIILVLIATAASQSPTIDVTRYGKLVYDRKQYSGFAAGSVSFDQDAFIADVAQTLHKTGMLPDESYEKVRGQSYDYITKNLTSDDSVKKLLYICSCVTCSADKTEGLSNGENICLRYSYDNDAVAPYNLKFTGSKKYYSVYGLKKTHYFDAFSGITVQFSGADGGGKAWVIDKSSKIDGSEPGTCYSITKWLRYNADQYTGLSNGDYITVEITPVNNDGSEDFNQYIRENGRAPLKLTKTFKVSGLGEFATSYAELSSKNRRQLTNLAKEALTTDDTVNTEYRVESRRFSGYYMAVTGDGEKADITDSRMVLVFNEIVSNTDAESDKMGNVYSIYTYVVIPDIVKDGRRIKVSESGIRAAQTTISEDASIRGFSSMNDLEDYVTQKTLKGYTIVDTSIE